MDQEKELWVKDYSVLVGCMYVVLRDGGVGKKDVGCASIASLPVSER